MSSKPDKQVNIEENNQKKDDARDSRLKFMRKSNEEVARKKLMEEAKQKCMDQIHDLGKCAQYQGLLVIFNCQQENSKLNDCLNIHYNEDKFLEYLKEKGLPPPQPKKTLWDSFRNLL